MLVNDKKGKCPPPLMEAQATLLELLVKVATLVPVVIFEKPFLNFTFSDLLSTTLNFDRVVLDRCYVLTLAFWILLIEGGYGFIGVMLVYLFIVGDELHTRYLMKYVTENGSDDDDDD
ncbi:hypothetical protein Tco_0810212 [Tanacetum coccineum]